MGKWQLPLLACIRFYLLFFWLFLIPFQWQFLATCRYGDTEGPAILGLAASVGTTLAMLVFCTLTLRRKSLNLSKSSLGLLMLNSAFGWYVARYLDAAWASSAMFSMTMAHAGLGLTAISIEIAAVQSQSRLSFSRVRIWGSLGFLNAACLSQAYPSTLLWICPFVGVMLLLLPMVSSQMEVATQDRPERLTLRRQLGVLAIFVAAFSCAVCARGFDIYAPVFLRSRCDAGLQWLIALIIVECLLLLVLDQTNGALLVALSAVIWGTVYLLLLCDASTTTCAVAMVLAGVNCPTGVMLQNMLAKLIPGATPQALLASAVGMGGLTASILISAMATKWEPFGILRLSAGLCIVAVPFTLLCGTLIAFATQIGACQQPDDGPV